MFSDILFLDSNTFVHSLKRKIQLYRLSIFNMEINQKTPQKTKPTSYFHESKSHGDGAYLGPAHKRAESNSLLIEKNPEQ